LIITLVAGILQVYAPPAERVALNRPILTTLSLQIGFIFGEPITHFSQVVPPTKSDHTVAFGILDIAVQVTHNVASYTAYSNKSTSFVANSELHRLNQELQDCIYAQPKLLGLRFAPLVIVLITPPICILTGLEAVGSLPS